MAEEEKFKAARNASVKNAKSLTSATAEASTSVQKELDSANKNIYRYFKKTRQITFFTFWQFF